MRPKLEALEGRVVPTSLLWVAKNPGNWSVAANFADTNGNPATPGKGDALIFDPSQIWNGKQGTATSSTDDIADPSLGALSVRSGYTGTITLNENLTVTSGVGVNLAGGTIAVAATSNFTIGAVDPMSAGMNVWSGTTLTESNLAGSGETWVDPGASLTIPNSTASVTLANIVLNVLGTVNWNGGTIHANGANIQVDGGGLFTTNTDAIMDDQAGVATFTVFGQFTKTGSNNMGGTSIYVSFFNEGAGANDVQVAQGSLTLASGGLAMVSST